MLGHYISTMNIMGGGGESIHYYHINCNVFEFKKKSKNPTNITYGMLACTPTRTHVCVCESMIFNLYFQL